MPKKSPKRKTLKSTKPGQKKISFRPGGLHTTTHTPQGKKIPTKKIKKALAGGFGPKGTKQARFARDVLIGRKQK